MTLEADSAHEAVSPQVSMHRTIHCKTPPPSCLAGPSVEYLKHGSGDPGGSLQSESSVGLEWGRGPGLRVTPLQSQGTLSTVPLGPVAHLGRLPQVEPRT